MPRFSYPKSLVLGFAIAAASLCAAPSYANSSPQEGFNAAVNAACRYKKVYPGVSYDRVVAYIFGGLTPPAPSYIDNFAKANRVDTVTAGSYMLGLVDWIKDQGDANKIYSTFINATKKRCG